MRRLAERRWLRAPLLAAVVALCGLSAGVRAHGPDHDHAQAESPARTIEVSPAVRRLLDAPYITDEERSELRVFHGVWTPEDLRDPDLRARAALQTGVWDDRALVRVEAPAVLRAEAALRRGEPEVAIALLRGDESLRAARVRMQSLADLGRFEDALVEGAAAEGALRANRSLTAPELVDAVRMLRLRARLTGEPASGYGRCSTCWREARRIDRLYWPASIAKAELLYEGFARRRGQGAAGGHRAQPACGGRVGPARAPAHRRLQHGRGPRRGRRAGRFRV